MKEDSIVMKKLCGLINIILVILEVLLDFVAKIRVRYRIECCYNLRLIRNLNANFTAIS